MVDHAVTPRVKRQCSDLMDRIDKHEVRPNVLYHPTPREPLLGLYLLSSVKEPEFLPLRPKESLGMRNCAADKYSLVVLRRPQVMPAELALLLEVHGVVVILRDVAKVEGVLALYRYEHVGVVLTLFLNEQDVRGSVVGLLDAPRGLVLTAIGLPEVGSARQEQIDGRAETKDVFPYLGLRNELVVALELLALLLD